MDGLATGIKKFDGTGYEVWSTLMEAVLTAKRIKFVLDSDPPVDTKPEQEKTKWSNANEQAKATILLSLSEEMVSLVISCSSAKDVWTRLKEVHSQQSEASKMMLFQEFYNVKMQPGTKVSSYVAEVELIAKKLRDVGTKIESETLISKIVSGLTPDFKHFASNWMSTSAENRTYTNLLPRLLAEEAVMVKSVKEEPVALKASAHQQDRYQKKGRRNKKGTKKTELECYHCGKKGHLKRECRSLKREQEAGEERKYAVVARTTISDPRRWFFDSGASFHMSKYREWFSNYKQHDRPIAIQVGNSETVYAIGCGSIDTTSIVNGEKLSITLTDVQFVPDISDNLFSQGAADARGIKTIAHKGTLQLKAGDTTIIEGSKEAGNMYILNIHVPAKASIAKAKRSLEEWHRVLGHPDMNEIKNLAQKGCTREFEIVQQSTSGGCGDCASGKAHRACHPTSGRERSDKPLHRVHMDLVGPVEPPTLNGSRYFYLMRDEFTSFMYVYFMKSKDETIEKIRCFINEASVAAQHRVQIFRSDNGSELKNESIRLLCDTEGIVREFSAPRTPEQNGEIERANRTVIETARTMLNKSGLPLTLWGEAVLTAVYLRNRLTNSRNRDKTPFELFHGRPPAYDHLIAFGEELHLLDSRRGDSKFSSKTIEAYMVGYGVRNRTYRCYNPRINDVVISADVIVARHRSSTRHSNIADRPEIMFAFGGDNDEDTGARDAGDAPGDASRAVEIEDQQVNSCDQPACYENDAPSAPGASIAPSAPSAPSESTYTNVNVYAEPREVPNETLAANQREEASATVSQAQPAVASARPQITQARSNNTQVSRRLYPDLASDANLAPPQQRGNASTTALQQQQQRQVRFPQSGSHIATPITLTGRGNITVSAPPRSTSLSAPSLTSTQQRGAIRGNATGTSSGRSFAPSTSATRAQAGTTVSSSLRDGGQTNNRPTTSGTGQIAAAASKGGMSPSKMIKKITPNFDWVLKDRAKRSAASKYARLAKAISSEPATFEEAINSPDSALWKEAIDSELRSLAKNQTWQIVPKHDKMREISVKWLFKHKLNANGEVDRYKARLVARGFSQIAGVDYDDVYAPVVHTDSLRLLFAICAQFNLRFEQFDIATAFLNGEIEEELYIQPPEGLTIPPNHTLRLLKSLYGLKQAPRCFNRKFKQVLDQLGMQQLNSDPCVFTRCGDELVILTIYVDDGIVFAKNSNEIDRLLNGLKQHFELKTVSSNYFLGLEIIQDRQNSTVFLHQQGYIKRVLERFGFSDCRAVATPLETGHSLNKPETLAEDTYECEYAELVGSLNYVATRTRPDISYALSVCSKYTDNPRKQHWQAAKRVLRYLQGTLNHGLLYKPSREPGLVVFSDADYGGDHVNRRSTSGMVSFINHGPVSYKAQQQQCVTTSTTEAEYIACTLAVKEIMWIKTFLSELKIGISTDAILCCDNQSAIRLIKNSELHQRTKHIDIRYHFIRERYEDGLFKILYVSSDEQQADLFTKALTKDKHRYLCDEIGCVAYEGLSPGRVLE